MRGEVLQLRGGEERARGIEGSRVLCADVERVLVNLKSHRQHSTFNLQCDATPAHLLLLERTFFNLALKKLLTRNLNRSSSVCTTMSLKLVFGSMLPVCSSTSSICLRH